MLATHADRKQLFLDAGRVIVEITKRYYEQDDDSVLPRSIACFKAFENAMSLDIAMGGSTNTILHLLAAAQEGFIPFTMKNIDELSRKLVQLCKVAPNTPKYHMEDVHRAGGVMAILGELDRAGLLHNTIPMVHSASVKEALTKWDIKQTSDNSVKQFYSAGPAGIRTTEAFSQNTRWMLWTMTVPMAAFVPLTMPTAQKEGLPFSMAILLRMAVSLKLRALMMNYWFLRAPPIFARARKMQSKIFSKIV